MSRIVLTCFCAPGDADIVGQLLRDTAAAPVHVRREDVLGRDFGDARNGERVSGSLSRMALEVEMDQAALDALIEALSALRRRQPLRWRVTPVLAGGRLA